MKTRCCRCRALIEYGNTYCDVCKPKVIKQNKSGLRNKEIESTTKSSRWKSLRKKILLRDKCCILCKNRDGYFNLKRLQVHHIVKRVDDESLIFEPSNLVTLCRDCHEEVEKLSPTEQKKILGTYDKELISYFLL